MSKNHKGKSTKYVSPFAELSGKNGFHIERIGRRPFEDTAEFRKKMMAFKKGKKWYKKNEDVLKRALKKDDLLKMVYYYYVNQMTMEEVGKTLGITKNSVSSRNRTVKNKLSKYLTFDEITLINEYIDIVQHTCVEYKYKDPSYLKGYPNVTTQSKDSVKKIPTYRTESTD